MDLLNHGIMKDDLVKAIRETLVVSNPKGIPFAVDRLVRVINEHTRINSEVILIFSNKGENPVEVITTFKDLLEKTTDDFLEDLEPECTSSSCNNESQNFCDCSGSFDEHEIEYVILK